MPVLPLVEIAPLLPARGALIGLDLGTKTIGVASSDPDRRLLHPAGRARSPRPSCEVEFCISTARPRESGDPERQTEDRASDPGFPLARERTGKHIRDHHTGSARANNSAHSAELMSLVPS